VFCCASIRQVAPKSFVDPRTCLVVFNHYCYVSLLSSISSRRSIDVSPELARSHHYRMCGFSRNVCLSYFRQTTTDDIMLAFKPRLQPAIETVMAELDVFRWRRLPSKVRTNQFTNVTSNLKFKFSLSTGVVTQ